MDKKILIDRLTHVEKKLAKTVTEVHEIALQLQKMVEENAFLGLENEKLREQLVEVEQVVEGEGVVLDSFFQKKGTSTISSAKGCLESLYKDGFHICNAFYGSRCFNDEECLLCLEMLDR